MEDKKIKKEDRNTVADAVRSSDPYLSCEWGTKHRLGRSDKNSLTVRQESFFNCTRGKRASKSLNTGITWEHTQKRRRSQKRNRQAIRACWKNKANHRCHTVGYPERLLLWTGKSVRHIQASLSQSGYKISHESIRQILSSEGYSLQTNRKVKEGGEHIDRDAQFEYINDTVKSFISANQPVISVDCKKKS